MTEACERGMSIMETYFDKLNTKDLKKSADQLEDEEDEAVAGAENTEDLIIYEAKDPYVLRSLPYLIGSQAFLDHDHVGLKDLDSEDEEPGEDLEAAESVDDSSEDGEETGIERGQAKADMFASDDSERDNNDESLMDVRRV